MLFRLLFRLLSLALVLGGIASVWPALRHQRELQQQALADVEREAEPPSREVAPAPAPAPDEEPAAPRTYYSYVDEGGSLRFVDSLERVPEASRKSARPISMERSPARSEPPHLARVEPSAAPQRRPFAGAAQQPPAARRGHGYAEVVVYSTSWCPWCRKTLAWLDARGVDYENRDIEKNPAWREELLEKSGSTSIPVVEIDGEVIRGFDPERMGSLL